MKRSRVGFDSPTPTGMSGREPETPSELARRVLFSSDLREKLSPRPLREESPDEIAPPSPTRWKGFLPARPDVLRFARASAARPDLPRTTALVHEESRGVLLHFFANHELLAAELMALALLKFPDAPAAFRAGLARTLQEEQRHTRWYLKRMQDCGVPFGTYPVSGFFWDAVSTMASPLDYVSRLSLTFEQANLDYSLYYSRVLATAGDARSAAILKRIYQDEIAHVGYGLKWFQTWKDPQKTVWEALNSQLVFPLSPIRAKGNETGFNREGRKQAGFDDDYIEQLHLFERSRGRTPNVYHFNPDAEHRIAAHPAAFHPNQKIRAVTEDLEILSLFLARKDDVVLLRKLPSAPHLEKLREAGFTMPELVPLTDSGALAKDDLLAERKLFEFRPWAKSPEIPPLFSHLSGACKGHRGSLTWAPGDKALFSKCAQSESFQPWFGPTYRFREAAELAAALRKIADSGWRQALLKHDFSVAGGGMQRIALDPFPDVDALWQTMKSRVDRSPCLEPCHERIFDFSIQYQAEPSGLKLLGMTEQKITPAGAYRGAWVYQKFCKGLDTTLARFLMQEALGHYETTSPFCQALHRWTQKHDYLGPLGVDAYIHRLPDGTLAHRVLCEINPRFTMGRVALEIRRQVAPGYGLRFDLVKPSDLDPAKEDFCTDSAGNLVSGQLVLNEIRATTTFAARITVARNRPTV